MKLPVEVSITPHLQVLRPRTRGALIGELAAEDGRLPGFERFPLLLPKEKAAEIAYLMSICSEEAVHWWCTDWVASVMKDTSHLLGSGPIYIHFYFGLDETSIYVMHVQKNGGSVPSMHSFREPTIKFIDSTVEFYLQKKGIPRTLFHQQVQKVLGVNPAADMQAIKPASAKSPEGTSSAESVPVKPTAPTTPVSTPPPPPSPVKTEPVAKPKRAPTPRPPQDLDF